MPQSGAITAQILQHPEPLAYANKIWSSTRYLVAQKPKTEDFSGTDESHYNGYAVIPGPKANPNLVPMLEEQNLDVLMQQYGITFIDFQTTAGADQDVVEAPYTVMSNAEADDYERQLAKLLHPAEEVA